ncbi:NADH-quinone oxidoreductase subunit J [Martelella endophytica]|uniref:NADH-quinone oxidoreductase subunit J n=1 Tax=Martelella endophytica TaxID=1486262 RepID=A0A0D5LRB0_MAREN|nr:NADH-quinone oxidoreductase subunit J [Martelella endophytica]AJY46460.1 NADH:ubiquinone oxidoreductase subunit J [Martelella endophytica]
MGLHALFFYLFAFIAVASALMVITARNPVHSVLFLIVVFVNAAALFIMAGAEYLGLLLLVVYVGAVAVLFLFVVMMLDIDFTALRSGILRYAPVGVLIGIALLAELVIVAWGSFVTPEITANTAMPMPPIAERSSVQAMGDVIYTHYAYFFQVAGLILLVAMIGAIVLTLKHRTDVKRQDIGKQVARTPETAHETVKVKPGQGI